VRERLFLFSCNLELHDLYSSQNIVRGIKSGRMRWVGHVARIGERRSLYSVLVGKPEGNRTLGRPRHRWEDNIKLNLQDLRGRACTGFIWLRIVTDREHM